MAIPVNIDAANAIELAPLPASVTQDVNDAGTTYTVWYKYTPVLADNNKVRGFFFFGDLIDYSAQVFVWLDPLGVPVNYLSIVANNKPLQIPVEFGTTYYFEVVSQFGSPVSPAILTITAYDAPEDAFVLGDIIIDDDTDGFPAAILNGTDATVRQFRFPFAAGEKAAMLPDGTSCWYDFGDSNFKIYGPDFTLITSVTFAGTGEGLVGSNRSDTFYIGRVGSSVVAPTVTTCSAAGVLGPTTWSLPIVTNGCKCIQPNADDTILYWMGHGANVVLRRFDLPGNTPLSDFLPGPGAGQLWMSDILVLDDDTIIVGASDQVAANIIQRYNLAGVLQLTYTTPFPPRLNRMTYALDDESFWAWYQTATTSTFINYNTATGAEITNFTIVRYNGGVYAAAATATPSEDFGHDNSCPFLIIPVDGVNISGVYFVDTNPATPTDRHDVYRDEERRIPDPTIRTALIGE